MTGTLSAPKRHQRILQLLAGLRWISIRQLTDQLEISAATARRDLLALAHQGKLRRVHGGAVALCPSELASGSPLAGEHGPAIGDEETDPAAEMVTMARQVAALVQDGETIFIGAGLTLLHAARLLRERQNLTVITNVLPVILALAGTPGVTIIHLGGVYEPGDACTVGHLTEQALADVRADKLFLEAQAIDLSQGLTRSSFPAAMTDRAILKIGRQAVVLAGHQRCGKVSSAFIVPLNCLHTVITDSQTPETFVRGLKAAGITVLVV